MARPDFAQWVRERIPAGRVGQPEDVAAAVVFAASPAASLMTGTSLVVDGGLEEVAVRVGVAKARDVEDRGIELDHVDVVMVLARHR